jgi:hypothetical protein
VRIHNQVLPLLDGLDDVPTKARTSCVQAITAYCHSTNQAATSLVVCCRSREYQALPIRLPLQRAVSILPLTKEQITLYLEQAGEQFKALRQVLNEDLVHSLARQPLMLSILMSAYQGVTSEEIPAVQTREQILQAIFGYYVDRMLNRRGLLKGYSRKQACYWLMFLAGQMHQRQQLIFSVENIQPNWLSASRKTLYRWSIELAIGLIIGPILGTAVWLLLGIVAGQSTRILTSLGVGLLSGLIVGLIFGLASRIKPVTSLSWPMRQARSELVVGVRNRSVEHLYHFPNEGIWRSAKNGLIVGLITWMFAGLGIGILAGLGIGLFLGFSLDWEPLLCILPCGSGCGVSIPSLGT